MRGIGDGKYKDELRHIVNEYPNVVRDIKNAIITSGNYIINEIQKDNIKTIRRGTRTLIALGINIASGILLPPFILVTLPVGALLLSMGHSKGEKKQAVINNIKTILERLDRLSPAEQIREFENQIERVRRNIAPQSSVRNVLPAYPNTAPAPASDIERIRFPPMRPRGQGGSDYDKLKTYSISDVDFQDALGVKPFLYYPDLQHLTNADQLFDKQGRCAILFLTTSLYHGHWTCLMKRGDTIEYWDSYGGYGADGERKWLSHKELVNLHEDQPLLSNLLRNTKYNILYNPFPYQSHSPQTNTCGKHCITRLYYKELKEPHYHKMIRDSGKTADQFVIDFVYSLIGK